MRNTMCRTLPAAVVTAAAVAMAMAAAASAADRYPVHDESTITKALRFGGAGAHALDVGTVSGSIRVTAYNGRDVQLEAHTRFAAESDAALADARRDITVDTADGLATISAIVREAGRPACGESVGSRRDDSSNRRAYEATVDFTIRVPADTRLKLCAVNGLVSVDGTSGDFDVQNVNGRIALEAMRGSGRAATVNGRVEASFLAAPRGDSLFKTVNGEIVLTLPAETSADLRMKTMHGGLFTDFEVVPLPAPAATPRREGGRLIYRANEFTNVRIGGGGPRLTLDTLNGNVRVLRGAR